jgi:protein-tyrosine phosphatase
MIDIHCHILPGIDDGPKDLSGSIEMARAAVAEGVTTILATPHFNSKYINEKELILSKVKELNGVLEEQKIPLTILPGQEPRINGEMLEDYEIGKILTLNDARNYLLVELPSNHVPRYTEKMLYDIQVAGLQPIIVHPERNGELIERPEKLYELVKNGASTQVTASSLVGYFGKNIQKFSQQIIEANMAHFIASDAHNITNRDFKMREAMDFIEKNYGMDQVYYFTENAEILLAGQVIYREIPEPIKKKKKFLGLF